MNDVIAAVSTANGTGGVAVIRLSGDGCLDMAKEMFSPSEKNCAYEPNRMYPGFISGEGFKDYGFAVYFKSPRSYTGEDVVEFHCHGGVQICRGILLKALSLGARAAEKGEFTKRAFLNGKLSLAAAEGVVDMINAESLALLRAGGMLYTGELTEKVRGIQSELTDVLAAIAAEIDYPEEDIDGLDMEKIREKISSVRNETQTLAAGYSRGKKIKNGVLVAICGKPNAGKSSLLNALLGYEKAIVSDEAGTTRDPVEGELQIDGVKYVFIDTAGLREGGGKVESIGIERAKNVVSSADVALFITDGNDEPPECINGELIRVFGKCDEAEPHGNYDIAVSSETGEGLGELLKRISSVAMGEGVLEKSFIVEERHYDALKRAADILGECAGNAAHLTCDLLAVDLRDAWSALGEITGETASEEIINAVFEKFCVGK